MSVSVSVAAKTRRFALFPVCLVLSLCLLLPAAEAIARTQAGPDGAVIAGTVHDPSGKVVANAAVVVRHVSTDAVTAATTGADGRFVVAGLPAGVYTVEVTAAGFATTRRSGLRLAAGGLAELSFALTVAPLSEQVTVTSTAPTAAKSAPSQAPLDARSAESVISGTFISDFTSPVSDYSQVIAMAPGTFSVSPNGVGLGDTKTYFRGFKDGQYTMTFDGIPFNDTNDPTHHSWAFFPAQFLGGTVFDRSPGSAATIGPSNFGGIDPPAVARRDRAAGAQGNGVLRLLQHAAVRRHVRFRDVRRRRQVAADDRRPPDELGRLPDLQLPETRRLCREIRLCDVGADDADRVRLVHRAEQQHAEHQGADTRPGRAVRTELPAERNPTQPNYYGYNFYRIPTDFEYVGLKSSFAGWTVDDKVYSYAYWNQQNYNSATKISSTERRRQVQRLPQAGQPAAAGACVDARCLPHRPLVEYSWTNRHQTPSDSAHVGRRGGAELPREVRDDPAAARTPSTSSRPRHG